MWYYLGMKIVIVGVSASGKSTFARKLADKLKIPVTHMDALMWESGWEYIGDDKTVALIDEVSRQEDWVIEGYITKAARSELFSKADKIIYLDYPGLLSAWRYVKRWWKYRKNPRPELPGSPEKFSFTFLRLVHTKGEVWKLERLFKESNWDSKIIRLKNPKDAEEYLNNL